MFQTIIGAFFPPQISRLDPEELRAVLKYKQRVDRNREIPTRKMMFLTDKPGRYRGFGAVVKEV
jgi:hypothetical protein